MIKRFKFRHSFYCGLLILCLICSWPFIANLSNWSLGRSFDPVRKLLDQQGASANDDDWKILNKMQCQAIKKPILLYNRIHKTGSTSTAQLIKRNAAKLQYKVLVGSTLQWEVFGSKNHEAIKSDIQYAIKHRRPWQYPRLAYVAHFYYLTISNLSYTYINMVRNPLDRYISHYYYQRFGDRPADKLQEMKKSGQFNETLQQCFQQQHQGCQLNVMTQFFCGYQDYCAKGNQRALNQAKQNILANYAVIGLLEEWELSSQLFRKILPEFFTQIHEKIARYKVNKNRKVEKLPAQLIQAIKQANDADYQLYHFIKQLFWTRIAKCGLTKGMR